MANVKCKECGDNFSKITRTHLESKHNLTLEDYKRKYPTAELSTKKYTNEEIISHVKSIADKVEGNLDIHTYEKLGNISRSVIEDRFGSWLNLKEQIGLETNWTKLDGLHDEIIQDYENGKSTIEIANEHDVTSSAVGHLLREKGVEMRDSSSYRGATINQDFFSSIDTEAKAWLLGFTSCDGSVIKHNGGYYISYELQAKDLPLLEKISDILESGYKIKHRDDVGTNGSVHFRIGSKKMFEDLAKYNVAPNKVDKIRMPKLPSHLRRHYIRGVFDADGWITEDSNTGNLFFGISGYREFLKDIQEVLISELDLNKTKLLKKEGSDNRSLHYGGNNQVRKIGDYLYEDAEHYLSRKKSKFENLTGEVYG